MSNQSQTHDGGPLLAPLVRRYLVCGLSLASRGPGTTRTCARQENGHHTMVGCLDSLLWRAREAWGFRGLCLENGGNPSPPGLLLLENSARNRLRGFFSVDPTLGGGSRYASS